MRWHRYAILASMVGNRELATMMNRVNLGVQANSRQLNNESGSEGTKERLEGFKSNS